MISNSNSFIDIAVLFGSFLLDLYYTITPLFRVDFEKMNNSKLEMNIELQQRNSKTELSVTEMEVRDEELLTRLGHSIQLVVLILCTIFRGGSTLKKLSFLRFEPEVLTR